MSFQTIELANDQVLVKGQDAHGTTGQTIIDGSAWFARKRRDEVKTAHADFDAALESFYAPILEAQEKFQQAGAVEIDPLLFVVEQEGSEGEAPQARVVVQLSDAEVILRAIEQGRTDRLLWVNDELVVTKASVTPQSAAPAPAVEDEGNPVTGGTDTPSV